MGRSKEKNSEELEKSGSGWNVKPEVPPVAKTDSGKVATDYETRAKIYQEEHEEAQNLVDFIYDNDDVFTVIDVELETDHPDWQIGEDSEEGELSSLSNYVSHEEVRDLVNDLYEPGLHYTAVKTDPAVQTHGNTYAGELRIRTYPVEVFGNYSEYDNSAASGPRTVEINSLDDWPIQSGTWAGTNYRSVRPRDYDSEIGIKFDIKSRGTTRMIENETDPDEERRRKKLVKGR